MMDLFEATAILHKTKEDVLHSHSAEKKLILKFI